MAKTKLEWVPIEEMDMEDGTHTCYVPRTNFEPLLGRDYVYLTQIADGTWDVEVSRRGSLEYRTLVNCKTLTSAKRWAARYL